jgi:hypothetical protein
VTVEAVEALVAAGDVAELIALFERATDAERARVRAVATQERRWSPSSSRDRHPTPPDVAAEVLFAATARTADAADWMYRINIAPDELLEPVVAAFAARGDRFLRSAGQRLLAANDSWRAPWALVRALVRRRLIDPIELDDDGYIRAFAYGQGVDLDADPALIERELWRLFEVSGALTVVNGAYWAERCAELAGRSPSMRARLLDAVLGSLATDFAPGQLRAYLEVAHALAPDDDELAARSAAVAALCAVPSPVRTHGLAWLDRLVRCRGIDPDDAVESLRPALVGPAKGTALTALRIAERLEPEAPTALGVAASALAHAHPDVVTRTITVLTRHIAGPMDAGVEAAVRAEARAALDVVPGHLRAAVAALAGAPTPSTPAREPILARSAPLAPPAPADVWADDRRLVPVTDPEQLVVLAASLLESEGDGDDYELLVGGIPSLATAGPAARQLFAPLLTRVEDRRRPSSRSSSVAGAVGKLVRALVADVAFRLPEQRGDAVLGMIVHRMDEAAATVRAGTPRTSLAAASHRGGHLHPDELAARGRRERAAGGAGLGVYDQQVAALRGGLRGATPILDVRHRPMARDATHPYVNQWPVLFTARDDERSDDPLVHTAVAYLTREPIPTDRRLHPERCRWWRDRNRIDVSAGITTLSFRPDLVAAAGILAVTEWMDYPFRNDHPVPFLEFLADPTVALEGPALTLLTLGFTTNADYRPAAVDSAIAAVDQGRLDPDAWARDAAALHAARCVTLTRVADGVADLGAAGPAQRAVAQRFLLGLVAHLEERPPTLYALLDVVVTLGLDDLRLDPHVRDALLALASRSSRAAANARIILQAADAAAATA